MEVLVPAMFGIFAILGVLVVFIQHVRLSEEREINSRHIRRNSRLLRRILAHLDPEDPEGQP